MTSRRRLLQQHGLQSCVSVVNMSLMMDTDCSDGPLARHRRCYDDVTSPRRRPAARRRRRRHDNHDDVSAGDEEDELMDWRPGADDRQVRGNEVDTVHLTYLILKICVPR